MTEYLIDAASYQGEINWAAVDAICGGGWEKVTQGLYYTNPYWRSAKPAMAARRRATGFTPGGYLFIEEGVSGAAQADFFASVAGDMAGFGIAIDAEPMAGLRRLIAESAALRALAEGREGLERERIAPADAQAALGRASSRPGIATVNACLNRLRVHYPDHRIGGYYPRWYWGESLPGCDWLWASAYVYGAGSPQALYARVSGQWAPYGGRGVDLLQFTSSAVVPGVTGLVDCSAFRGSAAGLAAMVLPGAAPPGPPLPSLRKDDEMRGTLRTGPAAQSMIKFPGGSGHQIEFLSDHMALGGQAPKLRVAVHDPAHGWDQVEHITLADGNVTRVAFKHGTTPNGCSVQRDGQGDDIEVGWDLV